MTLERNRGTVLRFFREVVAQGDLELLDELATEDYEEHVAFPGQSTGRAGLKQRIALLRAGLQPRHELHDVIVEPERVVVRWTLRGIHSGEFLGVRSTGTAVEFDGIEVYQMRDGRMAAHWNVVDLLRLHRQVSEQNDMEREART